MKTQNHYNKCAALQQLKPRSTQHFHYAHQCANRAAWDRYVDKLFAREEQSEESKWLAYWEAWWEDRATEGPWGCDDE